MDYFGKYRSGTLAAGGCQYHFTTDIPRTGRIYYKIFAEGHLNWSLLFSNIIDSTFADGSFSHAGLMCGQWEILSAGLGIAASCSVDEEIVFTPVTFGGSLSKTVMPGEYFFTDPLTITTLKDQYLCLELTYRGERIPCHPETVISTYRKTDDGWERSWEVPFPAHVGCDRAVHMRIGYLGDSITQGCGTERDTYTNWCAVLSELLGTDCSYWNLGLGYGRASDAASDSTWLYKAKQVDGITLCFGVNDILRGRTAGQVKDDLTAIVRYLHAAGVKVLLQTVPPFDYTGDTVDTWLDINAYLRNTLSKEADAFFDNVPVLSVGEDTPQNARYGGHPNAQGCRVWADALLPVMADFIQML